MRFVAQGPHAACGTSEPSFRPQDNKELTFKVKRSTPFSKIIRKWCEQMAQEESTVRFMFDGQARAAAQLWRWRALRAEPGTKPRNLDLPQPVNPTDSPHSLELEEGDTIDVMTAQTGGALSSH